MRMIVIQEHADREALVGRLLRARLSNSQIESALASLQALNPHVEISNLRAGTVLLVPDKPAFKTSASEPVAGEAFEEFQQFVRDALGKAAEDLKAGNAARAAERDEVNAVIKLAAFKRLLDGDAELKQQVADARRAFTEEQHQAEEAEQALAAASKAALAKLAELSKLLG